jgi:hypothetical protein
MFGKARGVHVLSRPLPKEPLVVTMLLTETAGLLRGADLPTLYVSLSGLVMPDGLVTAGRPRSFVKICLLAERSHVAAREGRTLSERRWEERVRSVNETQLHRVLDMLPAIGFPQRSPRVSGVVDTSMVARLNDHSWSFEVSMQSSGFDGADADSVRALCRELFALGDYDEYDPIVYDDAGLERAKQATRLAAETAAEAVRRSNLKARTLTSTIDSEGLTCPHCHQHTNDIRFIDRPPDAESYFICGKCGRSFVPADLERSD